MFGATVMVIIAVILLGGRVRTLPVWITKCCLLLCARRLLQQSVQPQHVSLDADHWHATMPTCHHEMMSFWFLLSRIKENI